MPLQNPPLKQSGYASCYRRYRLELTVWLRSVIFPHPFLCAQHTCPNRYDRQVVCYTTYVWDLTVQVSINGCSGFVPVVLERQSTEGTSPLRLP